MDFNYSYRAFLITCLLFGILFLAFRSITLFKYVPNDEEQYDVEYASEIMTPELDDLASTPTTTYKVETNRAYNEAEKFISEIEKESAEYQEELNTPRESKDVLNLTNTQNGDLKKHEKSSKVEESPSINSESNELISNNKSSKKNSTVSYSLVNRTALYLPNPVYTCASSGKIVINIVVSETGKVVNTKYNKSSSSNSNGCLIDMALNYAQKAKFTTFSGKKTQLGSITYNFPGQQ